MTASVTRFAARAMRLHRGIAHPGAAMPLVRSFASVARLVLSLAALAVLATARLPEPSLPIAAALRVPVESASPPASPALWAPSRSRS